MAATYGQIGCLDDAREQAAEVKRIDPDYAIASGLRLLPFKRSEDTENVVEGLRKAGLPE